MPITLQPVTADNWRDCAALTVRPAQQAFVSPVTYYLCLCTYGDVWHPLAVVRDGVIVGFVMWGVDEDRSHWIGGLVVDAAHQGRGVGHQTVRLLRDRLIKEPGCPNVALSFQPGNTRARSLYRTLGFRETGETEGAEVVARWTPVR
jgi:diamine N-acetyltransferase